jgi:hypothetical protein
MAKKYASKRRARGGRRYVRRAGVRKGARVALPKRINTGDFASATEQYSLAITAGSVYDFTFNLQDLIRTNNLANVYQYYRISGVELRFKPLYDTFVAQPNSTATSIPYLYFQYDKSGALQALNAAGFEEIGTKAIRLDDKTIIRKWKPSVLLDGELNTGVASFKVAPWLPTHIPATGFKNDQVLHYGALWYISKTSATDAAVYDVDVRVNVQYRKPLAVMSNTVPVAIKPPRVVQGDTTAPQL